jgi:hypothetical protein
MPVTAEPLVAVCRLLGDGGLNHPQVRTLWLIKPDQMFHLRVA